ncbi:hypothetical protein HH213_20250 [Duganella dendranthematis]|uniref:Uncharacterized protein n=1 Tax=Duganella dendranthematis TaxID=2728021 RepID=A0ABX6MDS2_9BURK|nr:hypothetical protein [Duganella dendranthematis]QJD92220.1 hypothetical protein HH213_20250 [Duganella dendranthematis]
MRLDGVDHHKQGGAILLDFVEGIGAAANGDKGFGTLSDELGYGILFLSAVWQVRRASPITVGAILFASEATLLPVDDDGVV